MIPPEPECVNPDAPEVPCAAACGKLVKTCYDETGTCTVHPDGAELSDGSWACSYECWEIAAQKFETA